MFLPTPIVSRRTPLAAALCALLFVTSTNAAPARDARTHARVQPADSPPAVTSLTVTNCDDSGPGSLRDAVANAVNHDDISLQGLSCATITLTTGAIAVGVDSLSIYAYANFPRAGGDEANGYAAHVVTIDGGGSDRVFDHSGSGFLDLQGFVLRNGYANGDGGCVRSTGNVEMWQTTVSGCHAHDADYHHGRGGGVFAFGDLTAVSSTISGNRVDGQSPHGGGVFAGHDLTLSSARVTDNVASGYLSIGGGAFAGHFFNTTQSTISGNTALADRVGGEGLAGGAYARNGANLYLSTLSGNSADDVGGLFVSDRDNVSSLASSIEVSTISGNQGGSIGGVLVSSAPLDVYNSTIAYNIATHAGIGGLAIGARATFVSTLVAGNTANGAANDIGLRNGAPPATTVVGDHNLIIASTIATPADTITQPPQLAPLADNGGPTQTHALLDGSPAIDHGSNPSAFPHDQRGYAREVGASADIGAFEFVPLADDIFCNDFDDNSPTCRTD